MLRHLVCPLSLAFLAGACHAQNGPGDQLQAAQISFMNCLARVEPSLDDQVSDAATIARALRNACPEDFTRLIRIREIGFTPEQQRMIEERAPGLRLDIALDVVLTVRAARAKTQH